MHKSIVFCGRQGIASYPVLIVHISKFIQFICKSPPDDRLSKNIAQVQPLKMTENGLNT